MKTFRVILWTLVVLFAGLIGWFSYEFSRSDAGFADKPFGVPFNLVDQRGEPVTEAVIQGRPTALFFGFTHCPEVCPTTLYELDGWLKTADPEGGKIGAYFITVDPERDTAEMMNNYITAVSNRITGVSGDPAEIAKVIKGFHIYAKKVPIEGSEPGDYTMDHTASVFLLDAKGRFKSTIAYGENSETAIKKLENLLKG